jgi:hypothetical protein
VALTEVAEPDQEIRLDSIGCRLLVADVYEKLELTT